MPNSGMKQVDLMASHFTATISTLPSGREPDYALRMGEMKGMKEG